MKPMKTSFRSRNDRGYTLIEALVVVAIIGMISVIAVPNFITIYRSGKVKTSLRNFTTDARSARQRAVSTQQRSMISFKTGTTDGTLYTVYDGTRQLNGTYTWAVRRTTNLESTVYFQSTDFTDVQSDSSLDVIFKENGEIFFATGVTPGFREIVVQGPSSIPNYRYRVRFAPSGQLKATAF